MSFCMLSELLLISNVYIIGVGRGGAILFCYIISFQCEKCNYLALIGGGGSDQFTASEKFGPLLPPYPNILNLPPPNILTPPPPPIFKTFLRLSIYM